MMFPSTTIFVLMVCGIIYTVDGKSCFPKCASGWVGSGGSCYLFKGTDMTWEQAKDECLKLEAYLAEINSASENNFLKTQGGKLGKSVWIGATDTCKEGTFEWDRSGTSLAVTDWQAKEPNNAGGSENCAEMRKGFGFKWNDLPCTEKIGYVCEKRGSGQVP